VSALCLQTRCRDRHGLKAGFSPVIAGAKQRALQDQPGRSALSISIPRGSASDVQTRDTDTKVIWPRRGPGGLAGVHGICGLSWCRAIPATAGLARATRW